jgi:hypothetical protein
MSFLWFRDGLLIALELKILLSGIELLRGFEIDRL